MSKKRTSIAANMKAANMKTAFQPLENNFVLNYRNKALLQRINTAKSTINNKPVTQPKHSRKFKKSEEARDIEEKNNIMARKLAEIYGRDKTV